MAFSHGLCATDFANLERVFTKPDYPHEPGSVRTVVVPYCCPPPFIIQIFHKVYIIEARFYFNCVCKLTYYFQYWSKGINSEFM